MEQGKIRRRYKLGKIIYIMNRNMKKNQGGRKKKGKLATPRSGVKSSLARAKSSRRSKKTSPNSGAKKRREFEVKIERLTKKGKERGFVTYDEILKEFPTIEDNVIFLDEMYGRFQTSGIDVLEGGGMLDLSNSDLLPKKNVYLGRGESSSYDSIQIYLKEIGQHPLIPASREKELAKQIEKGDMEAKNQI